ncbi:MAG: hypothetical protein ACP5U2_07770, partial [Bryobacteraceae bacterium]
MAEQHPDQLVLPVSRAPPAAYLPARSEVRNRFPPRTPPLHTRRPSAYREPLRKEVDKLATQALPLLALV